MLHRPTAPLPFALAVAGLLACLAPTVRADSLASFQLTNTNPAGTAAITDVLAGILPAGAVQPANPSVSPLTVLPGSSGFNADDLKVALGDGASPNGDPVQAIKLDFGAGGFASGGILNFALAVSSTTTGTLQLLLPPDSTGLALKTLAPTTTPVNTPPVGGVGSQQVPEPMSIALWSGLAGLVWLGRRAHRRSR